jgi:voltage-gated potassium channel
MLSFLLIIRQFGRAVWHAWKDPAFRFLALVAGSVLAIGTVYYHYIEGWRWLDSLYFCVMTLATVGYGDFAPKTDPGKVFTMLYVFIGIGLLIAVFTRLADALVAAQQDSLEKHQHRRLRLKKPSKEVR